MVENLIIETKTYSLEIGAPLNQIIEIQPSAQLTLEMAMSGAQGVSGAQIASVVRTTGSGIAGETDTYTITMTDASTFTFQVTNGAPAATMLTNTDLNTVVTSGTYGVIGALNTNIPIAGESYMEVLSDGTRVMQTLIYPTGEQYSRVLSGTWSAWLKHNTIANIDGLQDALDLKANQATTYTKDEVDAALGSTSASPILKPTITAPTSGTIDFSGAVTSTYATSTSFAGAQDYVLWEAGNIDFSVIYATYEGASNLTSWTPAVGLPLTTVYVRTKQGSDNHRSEYSDIINYVTPNVFINTPTLTVTGTPTDVPETPTLTTSAFAVTGGSDTHASTSWYVKLAGTTVWSSVADAVNLLSITVPAGILLANTAYTFEAFHTGTTYGNSATVSVSGTTKTSFFMTGAEIAKLVASDKAASDTFGRSVSINSDGTKVIVGANAADPSGITDAGAAYIYQWDGTTWVETKLTASDKVAGDQFGQSVSINSDGTKVIVGAHRADPSGLTNAGAAYIYQWNGTSWVETKLTASDKGADDLFGLSVSINSDGTKVIVGAYSADPSGLSAAGAAYIYQWNGTSWVETKLTASDKAASDYFGLSVSINSDGAKVIVGANGADPAGVSNAGAAYIYI